MLRFFNKSNKFLNLFSSHIINANARREKRLNRRPKNKWVAGMVQLASDVGAVPYVGSVYCWFLLCSEGFSPSSSVFLPPQKPTSPNSNSTRIEDPHENQLSPL